MRSQVGSQELQQKQYKRSHNGNVITDHHASALNGGFSSGGRAGFVWGMWVSEVCLSAVSLATGGR